MSLAIRDFDNIHDLLGDFFAFLRRHTDFYHTLLSEEQIQAFKLDPSVNSRGFKPGQMIDLVNNIIIKNLEIYRSDKQPYLLNGSNIDIPPKTSGGHANMPRRAGVDTGAPAARKPADTSLESHNYINSDAKNSHIDSNSDANPGNIAEGGGGAGQNEVSQRGLPLHSTIPLWNGGSTDKYHWNQSLTDLTVEIVLGSAVRGRDVSVSFFRDRLRVLVCGEVLIEGELGGSVTPKDCLWSLEDNCRILISMEKSQEVWWDCVIQGHEKINTQEIESTKNIADFSPSEQEQILKLVQKNRALKIN